MISRGLHLPGARGVLMPAPPMRAASSRRAAGVAATTASGSRSPRFVAYGLSVIEETPRGSSDTIIIAVAREAHKIERALAELGQRCYARGWASGTSGNFSAVVSPEPLRLAITASARDK